MAENLAGVDPKQSDRLIRRELTHARIEIVEHEGLVPHPEVHTHLTGKLGGWTFTRNWCYWVAHGEMPIELARELYADPLGRDDVRVGGHCGCPSPDEYRASGYHVDSEAGLRLLADYIIRIPGQV